MNTLLLSLALILTSGATNSVAPQTEGHHRRLPIIGSLQTDVAAIGGETTGVVLHTTQGSFELALSEELISDLKAFNGKVIAVSGTFKSIPGVEIPIRNIIDVESIGLYAKKVELTGSLSLQERENHTALTNAKLNKETESFEILIPPHLMAAAQSLAGKEVNARTVRLRVPAPNRTWRIVYWVESLFPFY
jgi:hypothetical protein